MTSPSSEHPGIILSSRKSLALTSGSRVLKSPLGDETIWKRLKEAGFDEESIKKRDKAALIAYIAKLEAEIFDHQHHMGLLILEKRELASKYEQIKTSAETAEILHKRDQAVHLSSLAEAKKREENLKKTIGIKDECIASIEKALHEMRLEAAEIKVAAESKLAEARNMVEDSQKKFTESEAKLHSAESLQAEASRYHRTAERMLQEIKAREDELMKRIISFKSDCDKKEEEMALERQSLSERQKTLQQEHERLLDGQALLNQREDYIFSRSQELNQHEKELEDLRTNIEKERKALNDEKSKLELSEASLSNREEAVVEKEVQLNRKEQELLILQEKNSVKESDEIQKMVANHEIALRARIADVDAELESKRKVVEDEVDAKRRAWELREMDLRQREDLLVEKEHDLGIQSRSLANKEKDLIELSSSLDEKEKRLGAAEQKVELDTLLLQKEKEEFTKMKLDLQSSLEVLENKKNQVDSAKEKLEVMRSETNELSALEMKLKEEIDLVRIQKLELMVEADKMKAEKAKFEAEWESIDEKREELQKEVEYISAERAAVSKFIKDERDSLRVERDAIREQFKQDLESLCREREEFMNKMVCERSEWLNKMQQERTDLILDMETQKKDLENCLEHRREELESHLRERIEIFEREKKLELENISSLKERVARDMEQVHLEMKRLEAERMEINLDREKRNKEWAELNDSIEELKVQREKLEKQRELLHADREDILVQIDHLRKFEDLKAALNNMAGTEMQQTDLDPSKLKSSAKKYLKQRAHVRSVDLSSPNKIEATNISNGLDPQSTEKSDSDSPLSSTPFSWIKRCTELIFKHSPDRPSMKHQDNSLVLQSNDENLTRAGQPSRSSKHDPEKNRGSEKFQRTDERLQVRYALGEPKVIVEVPSSGEDMEGRLVLDSETKEDASIVRQSRLAGRKRGSSNSLPYIETMELRNKKKQRQQELSVNPVKNDLTCSFSEEESQLQVPEDQHTLIPSCQSQEGEEDTGVVIVDKIVKVSEVTCEKTDYDNLANQNESNYPHISLSEVEHDIIWSEVINGHSSSQNLSHVVLPCGGEEQKIVENLGQITDQTQGDTHRESQQESRDLDVDVRSDKVTEEFGYK